MGMSLSSDKYSLEIAEVISTDNTPICCSMGDYEYILSDDEGYYLFKKKGSINHKWLLYEGILGDIITKRNYLYLIPFINVNDELLEQNSIEFNNFYEMSTYARINIKSNILNVKILEYNRKNIKSDYIGKVDSDPFSNNLPDISPEICLDKIDINHTIDNNKSSVEL